MRFGGVVARDDGVGAGGRGWFTAEAAPAPATCSLP
jgi:hypothetical protein